MKTLEEQPNTKASPVRTGRATVSFHLSKEEKEKLTETAIEKFGSVTDYIHYKLFHEQKATGTLSDQQKREYEGKIRQLTDQVREHEEKSLDVKRDEEMERLKQRIAFYENDFLKKLFADHQGETVEFKNREGEEMKITITNIQDVYTIIINSFTDKN